MSKPKRQARPESKAARQWLRDDYVAGLREGRRQRASTFTNRKQEASRRACRGRIKP